VPRFCNGLRFETRATLVCRDSMHRAAWPQLWVCQHALGLDAHCRPLTFVQLPCYTAVHAALLLVSV
jgi:hypothetical protein